MSNEFLNGLQLNLEAVVKISQRPTLYPILITILVSVSFFSFIATKLAQFVILLPAILLLSLTNTPVAQVQYYEAGVISATEALPMMLVVALQYVYPRAMAKIFLLGVENLASEQTANYIKSKEPKVHWLSELRDYARRCYQRLRISLLLLVASWIPFFGHLVVPLAMFYISVKSLGVPAASALAILSLVPQTVPISRLIMDIFQDARWFGREWMEPFFQRERFKPKHRREWLKKWGWYLLGFSSIVAVIGRSFWWLNIALFVLGQVNTGLLVERVLESNK